VTLSTLNNHAVSGCVTVQTAVLIIVDNYGQET
jgi:hypothetical protein